MTRPELLLASYPICRLSLSSRFVRAGPRPDVPPPRESAEPDDCPASAPSPPTTPSTPTTRSRHRNGVLRRWQQKNPHVDNRMRTQLPTVPKKIRGVIWSDDFGP